jgi:hypothetical protein
MFEAFNKRNVRERPRSKPLEERLSERIHTDDPLSRYIWEQKFRQEEEARFKP